MRKIILMIVAVVMAGCGKAKPTPDATANKLFVEAVQLISSAEEQTGEAAIKDYEQGLANIQTIIADYSESDLAVKLISGETLFTGKSLKEIKERVKESKREAAEADSIAAIAPPLPEKSFEQRVLDGEVTEADLAKVTLIDFNHYQITDVGLKEVAKMQQLIVLGLRNTPITDAGLKDIAKLQKLTHLHLGSTKITDVGLKEVAKMQQLIHLDLAGNKVTKAGVAELQKALPKCKIVSNPTK